MGIAAQLIIGCIGVSLMLYTAQWFTGAVMLLVIMDWTGGPLD